MRTTMQATRRRSQILEGMLCRSIASSKEVQHNTITMEALWLDQMGSMRWRSEVCLST